MTQGGERRRRLRPAGLVAAALCATLPAQEPLFAVEVAGAGEVYLHADRNGVTVDSALLELGTALGWRVDFETTQLREVLSTTVLDLAFERMPARTVAGLIAAAGGADVVFDDRAAPPDAAASGARVRVHVVSAPDPTLETGRRRLRQAAIDWYGAFLDRAATQDPLVAQEGLRVRMDLARLRREQGDLAGAARDFEKLYELDRDERFASEAMLRIAQCYFDLGQLELAETWVRRVVDLNPQHREVADAVILLGQVLIAAGRHDECVREMRANQIALAETPQIVDLFLLLARSHVLRGRPDEAFNAVQILAASKSFRDLDQRQFRDYWYLRGVGAEGMGKPDVAMEALELFCGFADDDPRRGPAMVLLARSYLALGRCLEARAAAIEAGHLLPEMDRDQRREARIVQARAALATLDRARAFEELEVEVRGPDADPELILFLCDAFLEVGRYQKAIHTADLLLSNPEVAPHHAELGVVRKLVALLRQAGESREGLVAFTATAIPLAARVTEPDLQRQLSELVGEAYERLGDLERAADAFRGVLR